MLYLARSPCNIYPQHTDHHFLLFLLFVLNQTVTDYYYLTRGVEADDDNDDICFLCYNRRYKHYRNCTMHMHNMKTGNVIKTCKVQ